MCSLSQSWILFRKMVMVDLGTHLKETGPETTFSPSLFWYKIHLLHLSLGSLSIINNIFWILLIFLCVLLSLED